MKQKLFEAYWSLIQMEHANLSCILKINMRCDACKRKALEVLNSICGAYSVTLDGKDGEAKIWAEVDPNVVLRALARTGQHAELVWAKLDHPRIDRGYYNDYDSYGSSYRYPKHGYIEDTNCHRRALPQSSYYPNYYCDAAPLPAARYEYPYGEDQSMGFCSIM